MKTKISELLSKLFGYDLKDGRKKKQALEDATSLIIAMTVVLISWKFIMIWTNCTTPIVVVVSGSMEPAFYRGDILFITNLEDEPVKIGDIIVFSVKDRPVRLVHRVIRLHQELQPMDKSGVSERNIPRVEILTKGDNNVNDDSFGIYASGQKWLKNEDIHGKVKGYLPYIGYLTIFLNEYRTVAVVLGFIILLLVLKYNNSENEANTRTEIGIETDEENQDLK